MPSKSKTTTEKDLGIGKVRKAMEQLSNKPYVKTGILESAGSHKDENGKPTPLTVANIAIFQEFGTPTIPKRPFMRYSSLVLRAPMERLALKVIEGMALGKLTLDQGLDIMGLKAVAEIKKIIVDWDTPPNAQSTIENKARKTGRKKLAAAAMSDYKSGMQGPGRYEATMSGYNNPLIDTSQMLNSITHEKVK